MSPARACWPYSSTVPMTTESAPSIRADSAAFASERPAIASSVSLSTWPIWPRSTSWYLRVRSSSVTTMSDTDAPISSVAAFSGITAIFSTPSCAAGT